MPHAPVAIAGIEISRIRDTLTQDHRIEQDTDIWVGTAWLSEEPTSPSLAYIEVTRESLCLMPTLLRD
jgi:hypothetical protein